MARSARVFVLRKIPRDGGRSLVWPFQLHAKTAVNPARRWRRAPDPNEG